MNMPADDSDGSPDMLRKQARVWLRQLSSGDVRPWDARAFQRWLRTSPAHKAAFDDVKRRWDLMRPAAGELLRTDPEAAGFHSRAMRGFRPGRRAFLGAAASAVAVAGVAVIHPPFGLWPSVNEWGADYRTATGEQRTLALAAGVNVTLNTRTSVRRQMAGGQMVGLDLLAGEAAIDFVGAGRAFSVVAGSGRSVAESGRFEVRHLEGTVCVTCIDGSVRVEHPAGVRALQARQQITYGAGSVRGVVDIVPADVSAWRSGELVFNHTRLADVLDEINRYRSGRVVLANTSVRDSAVSGRFAIASLDAALSQLQHTFDLNARSLPGGVLVLS
jgi:transmembrane sensor